MTNATSEGAGNGQDANQAQAARNLPPMVVNAQYVKDLSFENPNAPQSLLPNQQPPQVSVNVDVQARGLAENLFEVVLKLRAEAKRENNTVFLAELAYGGLFTLNNVAAEHQRPMLLIEAPRMLFPFARAIIADATRDGGFPPLMVTPIDFVDLYRRQGGGGQAQAEGGKEGETQTA